MKFEISDRTRNALVWILGIAGVLLFILIGGLFLFIATRSQSSSPGKPGVAAYTLNLRPVPTTQNINEVFPVTLGGFTRKAVTGSLRDPAAATRFSATYTRDKETITINGARDITYAQAEADMRQLAATFAKADLIVKFDTSLSYTLLTNSGVGAARLTYQHLNWFFDIQASGQATLDEFMKAFKY